MTELSFNLPTIGQPNSTEDPKVRTALSDVKDWGSAFKWWTIDVAAENSTSSTDYVDFTSISVTRPSFPGVALFSYEFEMKVANESDTAYAKLFLDTYELDAQRVSTSTTYVVQKPSGYNRNDYLGNLIDGGGGSANLKLRFYVTEGGTVYIRNFKCFLGIVGV